FYEIFLGLYQGEETNLLSWNSHGCLRLFVSGIHRKADREKPHLTINQSVLHPFCWTMKWNSP
ncbi:TPA: hypothetical protein ACG55Z_002821, partial [Escherichia coli]